jgi:hypothetical protein
MCLATILQRAVYHWMLDPNERQAVMANAAAECIQEEYPVLVEIACANSSAELVAVKKAYHALYRRSLEEDVAARATGNLRTVCTASCSSLALCPPPCRAGRLAANLSSSPSFSFCSPW